MIPFAGLRHLRCDERRQEAPAGVRRGRHGDLVAEPAALARHEVQRGQPHHRPWTGDKPHYNITTHRPLGL